MKKILFIGHAYHKKTKSADFVLDLLSDKYEIEKFYIDPYNDDRNNLFVALAGNEYDFIVCWQIMFSIQKLKEYVKFKKCIFFPMYDGICALDNDIWAEYVQAKIICFCKKLYENLKRRGFDCEYIQYFPEPKKYDTLGDVKSLFFWHRRENINLKTVDSLFSDEDLCAVHLHKAMDPNENFDNFPTNKKITFSNWFDKKNELYSLMQKSALYMAPRLEEGIGMSFLEAMALGRCVIAPDNPTMNEYIKNGKTGILYDPNNLKKLNFPNIRKIQQTTLEYMSEGFKQWNKNKYKLIDWIEEAPHTNKAFKKVKTYYLFGFLPMFSIEEK